MGDLSGGRKEDKLLMGAIEVRVLKCSEGKVERCMYPIRKEDSQSILWLDFGFVRKSASICQDSVWTGSIVFISTPDRGKIKEYQYSANEETAY